MADTIQVQLTKLQAERDELSAKLSQLTASTALADLQAKYDADAAQFNAQISTLKLEIENGSKALALVQAENESLKTKEQDLEKRSTDKAAEIVAAIGHKTVPVAVKQSEQNAFDSYNSEADPAKRARIMQENFALFAANPEKLNPKTK